MKSKQFSERGQALVLIALAAIVLFGFAGLAIDGSAKFSDRRHAQNAADTAALAAALAKVNAQKAGLSSSAVQSALALAALNRATSNSYDNNLVTNTVDVYNPPHSGYYSNCSDVHYDCNDYIQVIITSNIDTYFARVIGFTQLHNRVEATAKTTTYNPNFNFGGNAIVALSPTGGGCSLIAGGSSTTTVNGGGLYSNSDSSSCSFKQAGCAGTVTVNGGSGSLTTVGGMNLVTSCATNIQASLVTGAKQLPFPPLIDLPEPAECSTAGGKSNPNSSTTLLTPGYFAALPGSGNTWKSNIVLTPGIYCIGTQMKLTGSDSISLSVTPFGTGSGVFIYFKAGGDATPISLQGGDVQLWAQTSGTYKNYLMYVAPNYSGSSTSCIINGSSGQKLRGTIYAPYCNMRINGTSGSGFESQLIGYTVDMSGNSNVTLTYDPNNNMAGIIPRQVGLMK